MIRRAEMTILVIVFGSRPETVPRSNHIRIIIARAKIVKMTSLIRDAFFEAKFMFLLSGLSL